MKMRVRRLSGPVRIFVLISGWLAACIVAFGGLVALYAISFPDDAESWPYDAKEAAQKGDIATIQKLIRKGANDEVNGYIPGLYHNRNCLMEAARCGHSEVVKLLLDHQAPLSDTDAEGKTALMLARENHYGDIVRLLQKAGATN